MMRIPDKKEMQIEDKLSPWIVYDEAGNPSVKQDAPSDVKRLYTLWMEEYIIPARKAAAEGAIFY